MKNTASLLQKLSDENLLQVLEALKPHEIVDLLHASQRVRVLAAASSGGKALVRQVLKREQLPRRSLHDLMYHFTTVEVYQAQLKQLLHNIARKHGHKILSKFLLQAIVNFTKHVAEAHSWYKHLPLGSFNYFTFHFNPTVNMHYKYSGNAGFSKVKEGDGGLTTDTYHAKFGLFAYILRSNDDVDPRPLKVSELDGTRVALPVSVQGPAVPVTAIVHYHFAGRYRVVLIEAVRRGDPSFVHGELRLSSMQSNNPRRLLRLPRKSASQLDAVARTCLDQHGTHGFGSEIDRFNVLEAKAHEVERKAHYRERLGIALSLRELCIRNLDPWDVPTIDEVKSAMMKSSKIAVMPR